VLAGRPIWVSFDGPRAAAHPASATVSRSHRASAPTS
jgi:hypothetical protein